MTASRKPVKNGDLWKRMDELVAARRPGSVTWEHVRGHSGDPGNDAADHLATSAIAGGGGGSGGFGGSGFAGGGLYRYN